MSGKFPAPLRYPSNERYNSHPSSRNQTKFLAVTCPHETAFAFHQRVFPQLCFSSVAHCSSTNTCKRMGWSIRASMDVNGSDSPSTNSTSGRTRLSRAIRTLQISLSTRIRKLRRGFFMKLLFFLVGFYCATAFATVIGQTGDWDILSAGLAVFVVEGIGALMYKASFPLLNNIRSLITMFNYWKAGLSLGLFLDAFKY
ncbi:hypothetical protein U1Q18_046076 [Sarracenia purpurea var. burkii]